MTMDKDTYKCLLSPLVISCNLLIIFITNYIVVEKTLLREFESLSKITEHLIIGTIKIWTWVYQTSKSQIIYSTP